MEKIKNLSEVILTSEAMLGEVIKPKRYILAPDGTKDEDSYIVVLRVGENVKDIKPTDIVIKYGAMMTGFPLKGTDGVDRELVVMSRGAVLIAVTAENFINPDKLTEKINI